MGNASALQALVYEAESTFGEDVTTFATYRLPVRGPMDLKLRQDVQEAQLVSQYQNDGGIPWKGCLGGTLTFTLELPGHGSATSGASTIRPMATLLGLILGAAAMSGAAGTTATGGTATVVTTTASGTISAGSLVRIGTKGDGRGNGQWYPVATHVTTNLTLLVAMDGAPSNGDVIYVADVMSTIEIPTTNDYTGVRFLYLSGNMRYELHGCCPTAVRFMGLSTGGRPQLQLTYEIAWHRPSSTTFPSTVTTDADLSGAAAAGSFFFQVNGTTTRNSGASGSLRKIRTFELSYGLGTMPMDGPGGANVLQRYVDAKRLPCTIEMTWTEDCPANTTTPYIVGQQQSDAFYHVCYSVSVVNGKALGFYWPKVVLTDVSFQELGNGINRFTIKARAHTGLTTTNDLTLSAQRMGWS